MINESLWNKNFILLCCNNFFQFMTHFLLMSTLPIFIIDALHGEKEAVGVIIGIYLISALFCRPFMGKWIDEFDRKKILLIATFLFFLPFCLYFFITDANLLFWLRLLHGFAFGSLTTATLATVAHTVPPQRTGEGIGYFAMAMTLGSVIGPMSGLYIIEAYSFHILFLCCLALSFLAFFSACLLKIHTPKQIAPEPTSKLHWSQFVEISTLPTGIVGACSAFAFSGIATFITLYTQELNLLSFAAYFFLISALSIFISRPFVGRAFDRMNPNYIIYPAILLFFIGLLFLSQAHSGVIIIISGILIGLGNGSLFSCLQALAIREAPKDRKGVATSTFFILFDIGSSAGSLSLGILAANIGYANMYLFTALVALLSGALYYWCTHRKALSPIQQHI